MALTPGQFRDVLGRLASGVTVVTARDAAGEPRGLTATAVCSVSLDPPLVLACLDRGSLTGEAIRASGRYALNFLGSDGKDLSERFASTATAKFDGVDWREDADGCPVLAGCIGTVVCEVDRAVEAGDHVIFLGLVSSCTVDEPGLEPLLHFRGRYRVLQDEAGP